MMRAGRLRGRGRTTAGERGFTLIELMVVILIIGIALGYGVASYGGFTEEQRLHSTVREFVGEYRSLRAFAAKERRECRIEIDIKNGEWRSLIYPLRDEMGNYVSAENEILDYYEVEEQLEAAPWKRLPQGVFIRDVQYPNVNGNTTEDEWFPLHFRQDGTLGAHVVHFATNGGLEMSIEVEEITGDVTVREGYAEFYSPQEEDFENLATVGSDDD